MTHAEIEQRKAEIAAELEKPEADVDALENEVRELNRQDAENRAAAAAQEALRNDIANGNANTKVITDTEVKHMEDRIYGIESKEYRNAWLKHLAGQTMTEVEERAYTQANADAVPVIVADHFYAKLKKLAPMLSEITLMRVAGNIKFVAEGNRAAADAPHTENSALTPAADTMVTVTLGAKEFVKIIQISKSALNQNIDQFEDWLVEILSGDIARAIDNYILNDTTNGVAAITYTTGTNQILNTATTGYTYKNLCDLVKLLPAGYDPEAKFITNKATLYGQLAQIVDSANRPVFVMNPEEGNRGMILGYPVVVDDYVTTANNALYLGYWKDVVGNLSEGVTVERDDHAAFASAAVMFRGYAGFDSKPAKIDAIARLVSTTA